MKEPRKTLVLRGSLVICLKPRKISARFSRVRGSGVGAEPAAFRAIS